MIKHLRYDFYTVVMPQDSQYTFQSLLARMAGMSDEQKLDNSGEHPVRLHFMEQRDSIFLGDMAKIRMNDLPDKMKLSGETNDLDLDADEGLGEFASFIYHPTTNVLVYMRNRGSVSISAFNHFIQNKLSVIGIQFNHILQEEAYRRLNRLVKVQRLDLEVAAPGNGTIFSDLELSSGATIDLMNASPRVRMAMAFSVGHERERSLPMRIVERLVTLVKQKVREDDEVSLIVTGREETLEKEVIDLFEDVYTDKADVNLRQQRKLSQEKRHAAILGVWSNNRERFMRLFAPREN